MISVVIPTFNEERWIERAIGQFRNLEGDWQIIVSDGGSQDRTKVMARNFSEIEWTEGQGSRADALNRGAKLARGEWILFLHADTQLPRTAYENILHVMKNENCVAGAFKTHTVRDHRSSRLFGWLLHLADGRSRYSRYPYGDQAIFVKRDIFEKIGGYPSQDLMEDLEFSRSISKLGRIVRVPASVRVSGRRMEAAPIKYCLCINFFPLIYALGVKPRFLARMYRAER